MTSLFVIQVVTGLRSLITYSGADAVSDLAIIATTLSQMQLVQPLLQALPQLGKVGDMIAQVQKIITDANSVTRYACAFLNVF